MKEKLYSIRGQVFYTDFIVGIVIIVFVILLYYGYIVNTMPQNKGDLNELITDMSTISTSLLTSGSPEDWNRETVHRIGLTNNAMRLQMDKAEEFQSIDYHKSKNLFSTKFDYVIFFENMNGTIISIDNKCAIGKPELVTENQLCFKPNISLANPKMAVKDTRFAIYNNEIIRIVVYVLG